MLSKKILFLMLFLLFFIFSFNVVSADAIETMEDNLQVSIADIIMIIVSCGLVVMIAFDARIALMCALLIYTGIFILFTLAVEEGYSNFNPYFSGVAMMLCFVILCLSLLISYKKGNTPYNVV